VGEKPSRPIIGFADVGLGNKEWGTAGDRWFRWWDVMLGLQKVKKKMSRTKFTVL
jgi:hypothetical protein